MYRTKDSVPSRDSVPDRNISSREGNTEKMSGKNLLDKFTMCQGLEIDLVQEHMKYSIPFL